LAQNNIYMRSFYEQFPSYIANLIDHIRKDYSSPGPSLDQIRQDTRLERLRIGTAESDVESYFRTRIFSDLEPTDVLQRTDRNPMAKHAVPDSGYNLKVSTPMPNMLFGYRRNRAFLQ
jgi:hypothetical protein